MGRVGASSKRGKKLLGSQPALGLQWNREPGEPRGSLGWLCLNDRTAPCAPVCPEGLEGPGRALGGARAARTQGMKASGPRNLHPYYGPLLLWDGPKKYLSWQPLTLVKSHSLDPEA